MGYRLLRGLLGLLIRLFYRRVEVVGLEAVPPAGPLIVAANHQNALVDAMLLVATLPRPLRPLAKAPLFRNPLIRPFLGLVGAIPVHRRQEGGSDPARNAAAFAAVGRALGRGEALMIFPEGVSQPEPALMPLRTGAARMLLAAEESAPDAPRITLLPVGLVFHEPGAFRAGWALVLVGPPVPTADVVALGRGAPEIAARLLTDRLATGLRALIVEADDRMTLRLVRVVEAIWREESGRARADDPAASTAALARILRAYRYLAEREPRRVARLRAEVERYAKDLEVAGLGDPDHPAAYPPGRVIRYALREGGALVVGLPLALAGLAIHALPYQVTGWLARALRPEPDTEATIKLAASLVAYPLCWVLEGGVAGWLGGGLGLVLFLAALVPTGFFALAWRDRLERVRRDARGFSRFLADRDLPARLAARRAALMRELAALARSVPEPVLHPRAEGMR